MFQLNLNNFSKLVFRRCLTQVIQCLVNFLSSSYPFNSSPMSSLKTGNQQAELLDGGVSEGGSQWEQMWPRNDQFGTEFQIRINVIVVFC